MENTTSVQAGSLGTAATLVLGLMLSQCLCSSSPQNGV